jgi:hypothetical protein
MMAFTGQKIKGSRVLTPETIENRKKFHQVLNELKEMDESGYNMVTKEVFSSMFEHLSHSSQKEIIKCAERVLWKKILS